MVAHRNSSFYIRNPGNNPYICQSVAKCSNVDCSLTVFRNKGEKQLTDSQITDLVTKGRTALIKGFRSREDKPFDAYLTFDKDFRIVYGFPPHTDKSKGKEHRR